jgi:asparagine synthase (glutamine-hydrolysing)
MIIPHFVVDDQRIDDPAHLTTSGRIRLGELALMFSAVSMVGEFQPTSVWDNSQKVWSWKRPSYVGTSIQELRLAFHRAVIESVGDASVVAVSFSGGLDSLAILKETSKYCSLSGRRCVAITADVRDDCGDGAFETAQCLIHDLRLNCEHVRIAPEAAVNPPLWTPVGPRLEAMPNLVRAISDVARMAGAQIILSGDGADELLGTPRYLIGAFCKSFDKPRTIRFLKIVAHGGWNAVRLEFIALMTNLVPTRKAKALLYWAANWPDLCSLAPPNLLSAELAASTNEWQRKWVTDRITQHADNFTSWAEADAWDNVCPMDRLPDAGGVHEACPFLNNNFVEAAQSIPLECRFEPRFESVYHAQKGLVVSLIDQQDISHLPKSKQIFSCSILGQASDQDWPVHAIEVGLLSPDALRDCYDMKLRLRIRAVEEWIKEARFRGYKFVP